jgi:hypothetical protein
VAGLNLISPSSQRGCCTFNSLLMFGYFTFGQFGRLESAAGISAKSSLVAQFATGSKVERNPGILRELVSMKSSEILNG